MEKNLVGFRFSPTGEELINHYLKNKNLGKTWRVDEAISEINICSHDPMFLPSLSKLESDDPVWYFFSPKEYTTAKKKVTKRTTPSGYWKATGMDRKIRDKRGNGVEIGIKKTLVYHHGRVPNGLRTPWVMHEYHITSLPLNQLDIDFVICQVMYKGEGGDLLYGNNSTGPSHSMVSDSNTLRALEVEQPSQEDGISVNDLLDPLDQQENLNHEVQPQTQFDDDYWTRMLDFHGGNFEDVFPNLEVIMQGHHNDHKPKKALTGFIVDDCSIDSDAESISETSYKGTSSSGDSDGSSSKHLVDHFTRRTIPSKQEVKEGKSKAVDASMDKKSSTSMVKMEKKGWFTTEAAMQRNHKNPVDIYLMNMIIGFILLVAVICDIISILLCVKT